jgi:CoA:oxalate CoA-transferase
MSRKDVREGASLLEGIKVIDFTRFLAGPTCTRILADFGADVIKVEQPPFGDFARRMHPMPETKDVGPMFLYTGAGKKSICINLKPTKGATVMRRLIASADVVVDNFAPRVMRKLGLDYRTLREINPRIIAASISGFGQFGPWAEHKSFDIISQALSGVMHVTGEPDGKPQYVGDNIGDPVAGLHAALAVCGALFRRERTGQGQFIDISQLDSLFWIDMFNTSICALSHGRENPMRFGSHHYAFAPLGVFKASKGYVVIHVFETTWQEFCVAISRPDIYDDARFAHNADRLANRDELIGIIEGWLAGFDNPNEAVDTLHRFGVPAAPVLDIHDALHHPQIAARCMVSRVRHPVVGWHDVVETPFHLSETPGRVRGPAPLLGEHNTAVLSGLGFSAEEIETLRGEGILVEEREVHGSKSHSTTERLANNEYA